MALEPLKFGMVTGRLVATIADSVGDMDRDPDIQPLTGGVTFTPAASALLLPGASPDPATALPMPITAILDDEGYLSHNGVRGVRLVASVNNATNPSDFTYKVSFALRMGTLSVQYPAFDIMVPADGVVDLTTVAPVPRATGTPMIQGVGIADVQIRDGEFVFLLTDGSERNAGLVPVPDSVYLGDYARLEDLASFATRDELDTYVSEDEIVDKADRSELSSYAKIEALDLKADKTELDGVVRAADLADYARSTALESFATQEDLQSKADKSELVDYAKATALDSKADKTALSDYATTTALTDKADKTELAGLATNAALTPLLGAKADVAALANYATTAELADKADRSELAGVDAKVSQLGVDVSTAGAVKSVNGQTGNVVVDSTNVLSQDGFVRGRGVLPNGADLNAYRAATDVGVWELSASNSYSNSPIPNASAGLLIVHQQRSIANQRVIKSGFPESWERSSLSSSGWNAWAGVNVTQLAAGTDLDTLRSNNDYIVRNMTDAANMNGWPTGIPRIGARISVRASTTGLVYQQMQTYGDDPRLLIRSTAKTTPTPYPFSEWKDATAPPPAPQATVVAPHAGVANALLLQDFTRRRPVVKTGGKPVVSLRFDHGLKNFNTMVVPHLKRLDLPAAICLNAGDWSRTENNGVTKEMVNTWVTEGWLEIWNHALNHVDVTDPAKFQEQIVTGLTQLRADLPAATIDGFMPVGSGPYIDFNGGNTVESWWGTDAGRLILQHHAVASGYIPGTVYRVLDGQPRQGQGHFTVDTMTLDDMQVRVEGAYSPVRGVQLMLHPSRLDTTGYLTSADYVAFLEWVAVERDAGRLVVLGAYDMLRADSSV